MDDAVDPMAVPTADEISASEDMEQASDMEPSANVEGEDPLTNSIPSAVVLGAGDADADLAVEPESDDGEAAEMPNETEQE